MTKLLDQAIEKVRQMPDDDQDTLAITLLSMAEAQPLIPELDVESRSAIREGLAQAHRGESVPESAVRALWKRHGL